MDLIRLSAFEQAEMIRTRQISAAELVDATLVHIEETERKIHAFTIICADEARRKAADIDRRLAAGEPVGPLAGVPYSAKDVFCTRDIVTTGGSAILEGWKPAYNAAAVERMDAADAVLIGKTNCDEFAMGSTNENSAFGPPVCNPIDPERVPGGSSGGAAAAAAAFEGAIALGSDTGGSIREPSAFCGTVGLKPTYGRISRWGLLALASSMDTVGPITRTVRDAALSMDVLAGFDPRDNTTVRIPVPDHLYELEKGVCGMRIGLSPDLMSLPEYDESGSFLHYAISPEIREAVERTAALLEDLGAVIVENVPMPNTRYSLPAYSVISRIEAYSNMQRYDGLKYGRPGSRIPSDMQDLYAASRGEGFGREVKLRILMGLFLSQKQYYDKYYQRAQKARALIRRDCDLAFAPDGKWRLDVLLMPTTPTTAFRFERDPDDLSVRCADQFTSPMNFSGIPAISFPVGRDSNGMPIGVQAAAYDFCETKLLRTAYAFEQAFGGKAV